MRSMVLAALATLFCLGLARPAAASSTVILPRTGGSGVGPEARDAAREALREVLVNEGWTVFGLDEVSTDLPPRMASCAPDDRCAFELRSMLDVDVVVGLRVWGTEGAVERVAVVVVGVRGVGHRALAEVTEERPLPFAVAEAARGALALWETVRTTEALPPPPPDDDRAEGFEEGHLEPSPINWFLGGLLVLGSAPVLGYGINSAVRDGDCVAEGPGGTCTERIRFREGAGIFTALGATLLAGGVLTWILQPVRVAVHADVEQASIVLSGRF
ncbi:MAG TPA: hypothetical protein RMH99_10020 [Sandaracinaceae bacterium LLY-WYZ-13_1]|nr:hypothetical protein [Sandaracinaceae bacterium LLY-WYZ-13_1]